MSKMQACQEAFATKTYRLKNGRSQSGAAAVELAVILPLLLLMLAFTLLLGRAFWHYSVAQKAAHDAVMMLASATKVEIGTKTTGFNVIEVAKLVKAIAEEEVAELNPGDGRPHVEVYCDDGECLGETVPAQVRVLIRMNLTDTVLFGFTESFFPLDGLVLRADVRMPYVGG